MKLVCLVLLMACGPGLKRTTARDVASVGLVGADAAAIEKLLDGTVVNGGLYAPDPACAAELAVTGPVTPARFPTFARCLAGLKLRASTRKSMRDDIAVLTYGAGFEVEARIVREPAGARLRWIGFASRRDGDAPTISSDALEALRIAGDRHGPVDPAVATKLEGETFAWMHVCIDPTGAVTSTRSHLTSSLEGLEAFTAAARAWKFRPFAIDGKPIAACSMARMVYPPSAASTDEELPLPPRADRLHVTPTLLERYRRAGTKMVIPDDVDMTRLAKATGPVEVRGQFEYCVDAAGAVDRVTIVQPTGLSGYDRKIVATIQRWMFAPPAPACATVTFSYKQRSPTTVIRN